MTTPAANVVPKVAKAALAVIVFIIIVMVVTSYWGNYTDSKETQAAPETTATVDTTATPEAEGSPEGERVVTRPQNQHPQVP